MPVNKKLVISAVLILVVALVFVISFTNNNPSSSEIRIGEAKADPIINDRSPI